MESERRTKSWSCLWGHDCVLFAQQFAQLISAGVSGNSRSRNHFDGSLERRVLQKGRIHQCFVWSGAHSVTLLLSHVPIQPPVILLIGRITFLFWYFLFKSLIHWVHFCDGELKPPTKISGFEMECHRDYFTPFNVKKKKARRTSLFKYWHSFSLNYSEMLQCLGWRL